MVVDRVVNKGPKNGAKGQKTGPKSKTKIPFPRFFGRRLLYLMVCWQKGPSFMALGPINRAAVPFLGSFLLQILQTILFA